MLAAALLLAGCTAAPQVDYHLLSDRPRSDRWIPYELTDTRIAIGLAAEKLPIDLTPQTITCTANACTVDHAPVRLVAFGSPISFTGEILAIDPRSRHFVETALSPAYFDGSLRLRTLDVEVRDHRLEAINTIGAIVSGAAKIAGGGMAMAGESMGLDLDLPIVIDLAALKAAGDRPAPLPGNPGWTYQARFSDGDPAARGLLSRDQRGGVHGAILTAACRPMRIVLSSGDIKVPLTVTVADPEWLVSVPLPRKGTVSFHPLCGVDIQPGADTTTGTDVLAEALFKQIDAVHGALQH